MYQFVEDLKEEQYRKFVQSLKLKQERIAKKDCFYIGIAKDKKLVACCKVFIEMEKGKTIFSIPLGIPSVINEDEMYLFLKKYLLITAKKYSVQKIKIYSKEENKMKKIGFKRKGSHSESYSLLKKEKVSKISEYFLITEMNTERKKNQLKELKKENRDLLLFNNVTFFTLQLDLYTYLDTIKEKHEKEMIKALIEEVGDTLILENISIEWIGEKEARYIEHENYSILLQEERKNILFEHTKQELLKRGIKKLYFSSNRKSDFSLQEEIVVEYEYDFPFISNLISKN